MGQDCCKYQEEDEDFKDDKNVIRFFMVGTGGAGKTTVVRQLKCLCKESPKDYKAYNGGWEQIKREDIFSPTELKLLKTRIQNNIITALYNLIEQAQQWNYQPTATTAITRIRELHDQHDLDVAEGGQSVDLHDNQEALLLCQALNDEAIQKTLSQRNQMNGKYRIEDGTLHFLNEESIHRIFQSDTDPTCVDIVHSRYPTTDIQDFRFGVKSMKIQIHDMGGQVTELVKLPAFIYQWFRGNEASSKNFVLYVTSMADFNLVDEQNADFTAMDRSVRTLEIILGMPIVEECGVMIFFNKQDRFNEICTEMLKTENGRENILKYLGNGLNSDNKNKVKKGSIECRQLYEAVTNKFMKAIKSKRKSGGKGVYTRYTKAVDPQMMNSIFCAIEAEMVNDIINNADFIIA